MQLLGAACNFAILCCGEAELGGQGEVQRLAPRLAEGRFSNRNTCSHRNGGGGGGGSVASIVFFFSGGTGSEIEFRWIACCGCDIRDARWPCASVDPRTHWPWLVFAKPVCGCPRKTGGVKGRRQLGARACGLSLAVGPATGLPRRDGRAGRVPRTGPGCCRGVPHRGERAGVLLAYGGLRAQSRSCDPGRFAP